MKKLFVVRHGTYGRDDRLNDLGQEEIQALGEKLEKFTEGETVLILSSTADRARQSAEILAKLLDVESFEQHEVLWSEASHPQDFPGALSLIRKYKDTADIIILVTHLEYAEGFSGYFGREELGVRLGYCPNVKKGEAVIIDCVAQTLTHVEPWSK